MAELELTKELCNNIAEFMDSKGLAVGTLKTYKGHLKVLHKDFPILNKKNILKIMKKYPRTYHRAIFSIINEYCFFADIDFKVTLPRQRTPPRKIPRTLTLPEITKIIEIVPKPYDLFFRTTFGFGAGLRVSEVIRLSWQRFNWGTWVADKDKNGLYEVIDTKRGKNFYVTVPKNLMAAYYDLAKERNLLNEFNLPDPGVVYDFGTETFKQDLLAVNPKVWKYEYVRHAYDWIRYNLLNKICNKALGRNITMHMLRHSRATYLLEKGIPLEEISKLLGHNDIQTALIYAKVNMKNVVEKMENIGEI